MLLEAGNGKDIVAIYISKSNWSFSWLGCHASIMRCVILENQEVMIIHGRRVLRIGSGNKDHPWPRGFPECSTDKKNL